MPYLNAEQVARVREFFLGYLSELLSWEAIDTARALDPAVVARTLNEISDQERTLRTASLFTFMMQEAQCAQSLAMQAGSWFDRLDLTLEQRESAVAELIESYLLRVRFAPLGDNHHNATVCPYCRAQQVNAPALPSPQAMAAGLKAIAQYPGLPAVIHGIAQSALTPIPPGEPVRK